MNSLKIKILFSPEIERRLLNGSIEEKALFKILTAFISLANSLKLSSFILFPSFLKSWINSYPKLKILFEKIKTDTQTNILFIQDKSSCSEIEKKMDLLITEKEIIKLLINNKLPFLFTAFEEKNYQKEKCEDCINNNTMCYNINSLDINDIFFISTNLEETISKYCKISLKEWYINIKNLNEAKIKEFLIIYAKLKNVPEELIFKIESIKVTDEFLQLLKKETAKEIENILSSILRATLYPSSQEKNRDRNSIDFHRNSPFNINNLKIFRLDVLDWSESGKSKSGIKRILFAENEKQQKIFFYYDSDHAELSEKIIKNKLSDIL